MELGFILKKTISIFLIPFNVVMLVFLIGLFLLYKDKIKFSKIVLTIGFSMLVMFSYNPIANTLMNNLEKQYPRLQTVPSEVDHILLLGGGFQMRVWELLRIYNENKHLKIITSGYEGGLEIPEAIRSANRLMNLGIQKENIITHSKPKDTKEEAIKIKELLGDKPFILVTSGYHMPRAMALFKKEGTNPIAAPAHFIGRKISFISIPTSGNLSKSKIALHEYIGILWAKLRGQI